MSDFKSIPPYQGVIYPWSINSVGPIYTALGGSSVTSLTSNTWPTGSLAIFIPFVLESPMSVLGMYWLNGTSITGSVDAGVYTYDGRKLFNTGPQLQSGVSAIQKTIFGTPKWLPPGLYYLALAANNVNASLQGQVNRLTTGTLAQVMGMAQAASAFPLPQAPTLGMVRQENIPIVGITTDDEV